MHQRALAAADLDVDLLRALLGREHPAGVLSIFADAAPGSRTAEVDLRNRLNELQRRIEAEGPRERADALAVTLARLAPEIDVLFDPAEPGRGRALFAPLDDDEPTTFATQLPLANRVVLDQRPFVHPLLECLERGRPAGVALLSAEQAELLEWRQGELIALGQLDPEPTADPDRDRQLAPREQRRRRARDRRRRFLDRAANEVAELARERGWERLVVSGGEPLRTPLIRALPAPLRENAIPEARHLIDLDSNAVAEAVQELLDRHRAEADARLIDDIRDAALAGRGGALGLSEVAAALNEARLERLVYDPEVRFAGAVAADGRLLVPPERDPLGEPSTPEPRLTERIVERCLATGARITPVGGPAAATLAEMGGIAGRLRW